GRGSFFARRPGIERSRSRTVYPYVAAGAFFGETRFRHDDRQHGVVEETRMTKRLCSAVLGLMATILGSVSPVLARDGTFSWSGRVDGNVEIVVSGRSIRYRNVQGDRPYDVQYDFSQTMPYRDMDVRLNQREGRGSMRIVDHPDQGNGYTTVI